MIILIQFGELLALLQWTKTLLQQESISEDIEGETRTATSNPGADHYSTESVRYPYLISTNVGLNAYETNDTSESLYFSSITSFETVEETKTVTVTSNVDWNITDDSSWISVSLNSDSNNGSFNVTVSANT